MLNGRSSVIDGWRGVSVLLVIFGHALAYRFPGLWPTDALNQLYPKLGNASFGTLEAIGTIGVGFFFVISGYLITSLLIAEETKRDAVSLKAFYVRRTFRIVPALAVYVAAVGALDFAQIVVVNNDAYVRSLLYVCNWSGNSCSWWLAHTWSLGVEEQFYLIWPTLFALVPLFRHHLAIVIALALFVFAFWIPEFRPFLYIMAGVLVAMYPQAQDFLRRHATLPVVLLSAALVLLAPRLGIAFLTPFLTALVFFGTIFRPEGMLHRILSLRPLAYIGLVSYSLYLWQQLSLAPSTWLGTDTGVAASVWWAFIPLALCSFYLVETPMIALGRRWSNAILSANESSEDFPAQKAEGDAKHQTG